MQIRLLNFIPFMSIPNNGECGLLVKSEGK